MRGPAIKTEQNGSCCKLIGTALFAQKGLLHFVSFAILTEHQAFSGETFQTSAKLSTQRLFLPSSNDEDAAGHCARYPATRVATSYLDGICSDTILDPVSDQIPANDWNVIQPASSQWPKDDANAHRTLLCDSPGVTTPHRSARSPSQSALKRHDSYELSPSRITGFIRRSRLYVQDRLTSNGSTANSSGPASHRKTFPDSSVNPEIPVDSSNLRDVSMEDPLAEFDRWLASGAVIIIPD